MSLPARLSAVAFVGNYPPRRCGIATFMADLRRSVVAAQRGLRCPVVAINDRGAPYGYPPEVRFEVAEQDLSSYRRAAEAVNSSGADVVCLQHEFGIFGGPAGSHVLTMLRELRMPIVTTLHTVLQQPDAAQRAVTLELIRLSERLVVLTERGRSFLREIYDCPDGRIDVIPHGIPDSPFRDSAEFKGEFALENRPVLLTFGLLSPSKGIEFALRALPAVVREFPRLVYVVLGQTHPQLLREHGEAYRRKLEALTEELDLGDNVRFCNGFVEAAELKRYIGAADVYLTPYVSEAQIASGTLAQAFGSGKAVISTPYWHAAELLANGAGRLVPFQDSPAIAEAAIGLLRDEAGRQRMRRAAFASGRGMVWERVAEQALSSFARAVRDRAGVSVAPSLTTAAAGPPPLPETNLDHFYRLSDATGMFQHARYIEPNLAEGYCTDDNARALILTLELQALGDTSSRLREQAHTLSAFLQHAFDPASCRFRNFMGADRRWLEAVGSEDSHAFALWALGLGAATTRPTGSSILAGVFFHHALARVPEFTSPRAWSSALLGLDAFTRGRAGHGEVARVRRLLAEKLVQRHADAARGDWDWFEDEVCYANARLPHALIVSGRTLGSGPMCELGLRTLRWLTKVQRSANGRFRPVGCHGFYPRGGVCAAFDQQPIEAQTTVSACIAAFHATDDPSWLSEAQEAFDWFLGRNDLGMALYDAATGGCRDGLHPDRASGNQGAESTLAFLTALTQLRGLEHVLADRRAA